MATNTVENLLIGIGFRTDQKSFQNAEGSIDNIKSKALQLGSVLAGAFGAKALTFDFADRLDEVGKFAERWGIAANDVMAYDRALQHAGGTQGEFLGTVESLSKALAKAPFEKAQIIGDAAQFGIADQVSGVINATNALDGFLKSADALGQLTGARREKFIEALGFSDAEVRLLSMGREEIEKLVSAEKRMAPVTGEMTSTAARFNDEWQDLTTNLMGFSNTVATPLTGAISDIMAGMNDWIDTNRELIDSFLEIGSDVVVDNLGEIVGILSVLTGAKIVGGIGKISKGLRGIKGAGAATTVAKGSRFGAAGMAAGSAVVGAGVIDDILAEAIPGYREADVAFTDFMKNLFTPNIPAGNPINTSFGQVQQPVSVNVYLDGQPVKAIVDQRMEEQNEQAIQDFTTSNGG